MPTAMSSSQAPLTPAFRVSTLLDVPSIDVVMVVSISDKTVVLPDRIGRSNDFKRERRVSEMHAYFTDRESAVGYMTKVMDDRIADAAAKLKALQDRRAHMMTIDDAWSQRMTERARRRSADDADPL
jgi:hypothetical protein